MSKLFSACFHSNKHKHDKRDVTKRESPKRPAAAKTVPSKKPRLSEQKTRAPSGPQKQTAAEYRKFRLAELNTEENELPDLNIFRGLKKPTKPQKPLLDPDPFVGIPEVFGMPTNVDLREDLFFQFLEQKEAVMVFFYDPTNPRSDMAKLRFQQAARTTNRPNHAYAAVNCKQVPEVCFEQNVDSPPTFKLYSHGRFLGHYEERITTAADLKHFTETSSVAELPFMEVPLSCTIS